MRKIPLYLLLATSLLLITIPLVSACDYCCGCAHTIQVIPVDSTYTGDPIVTTSPANLMIFHTGNGPIENVWLLIVLNEPTYNTLNEITINGTTFMTQENFTLVEEWRHKIPSILPNFWTDYPGSLCRYEVAAIKDKMDEKGNPIYYGVNYFLPEITTSATYFTLAVDLDAPADLKALIIGLGRYDCDIDWNCFEFDDDCHEECHHIDCNCYHPLNRGSSFSKSTFVVPEIATIALAAAPFSALGLYAIKRRKK